MTRRLLIGLSLAFLTTCGAQAVAPRNSPDRALSVVVDLNAADLKKPLKPKHELAFQLEKRNLKRGLIQSAEASPGGTVEIFRDTPDRQRKLVTTLRCPRQPAGSGVTVPPGGFIYRQLFIWPDWRKAPAGTYLARFQGDSRLQVKFRLP